MMPASPDPMLPDLSHLTPDERKIIEEVMARQRNEEEKDKVAVSHSTPTPTAASSNAPTRHATPTSQQPPSVQVSRQPQASQPYPQVAAAVHPQVPTPPVQGQPTNTGGIAASIFGGVLGGILPSGPATSTTTAQAAYSSSQKTHQQHVIESDNPNNTCQLCRKTKFADGTGKECHFCHRNTCSRCGRRFALSPNQVIWSCTLCQKKQELLANNGNGKSNSAINAPPPPQQTSSSYRGGAYPSDDRNDRPFPPPVGGRQLPVAGANTKPRYPSSGRELPRPPGSTPTSAGPPIPSSRQGRQLPNITVPPRSAGVSPQRQRGMMELPGYPSNQQPLDTSTRHILPQPPTTANMAPNFPNVYRTRSNEWITDNRQLLSHLDEDITEFEGPGRDSQTPHGSAVNSPPTLYTAPSYTQYVRGGGGGSVRDYNVGNPSVVAPPHSQYQQRGEAGAHFSSPPPRGCCLASFRGPSSNFAVPSSQLQRAYDPYETYEWGGPEEVGPGAFMDRHHQQQFYSSSEDEVHTSIDGASYVERELDYESLSERGSLRATNTDSEHSGFLSQRRSKFLRGRSLEEEDSGVSGLMAMESLSGGNELLPPKMEENKSPVTWRPSRDGRKLMGHLVLNKMYIDSKHVESGSALGLKVVGGQMTASGRLGAFVTHVKTGSIADVVGQLKAGDEILEWNGVALRGQSFEDVFDIIMDSKEDSSVELIVQRCLDSAYRSRGSRPNAQASKSSITGHPPITSGQQMVEVRVGSTSSVKNPPSVELKLLFDARNSMLMVMLLSGRNLIPQFPSSQSVCCACVQFTLLPPNREDLVRISRSVSNTNFPRWNQSFVFPVYNEKDLQTRALLVQVFDCDARFEEWRLIGKVLIQLMHNDLSNTPCWYELEMETKSPLISSSSDFVDQASGGKRTRRPRDSRAEGGLMGRPRRSSREQRPHHYSQEDVNYPGSYPGRGVAVADARGGLYSPPISEHAQRTYSDPRYPPQPRGGSTGGPQPYASSWKGSQESETAFMDPSVAPPAPPPSFRNYGEHEPRGTGMSRTNYGDPQPARGSTGSTRGPYHWEESGGMPMSQQYQQAQERDYASDVEQRRTSAPVSNISSDEQVSIRSADSSGRHHRHGAPSHQQAASYLPQEEEVEEEEGQYRSGYESGGQRHHHHHHHHHHDHQRGGQYSDVQEDYEEEQETADNSQQMESSQAMAREEYERGENAEVSEASGGSSQFEMQRRKLGEFRADMERGAAATSVEQASTECEVSGCHTSEECCGEVMEEGPRRRGDKDNGSGGGTSGPSAVRHERHPRLPEAGGPSTSSSSSGHGKGGGIGRKVSTVFGRNKKSSSTSNLEKKPKISFQRCEEVLPTELAHLGGGGEGVRSMQGTGGFQGSGQEGYRSEDYEAPSTLLEAGGLIISEKQEHVGVFVEGLGPGQLVDRQILGMTSMGEMQLSFIDRKGHLEVEIIRARNLLPKSNSKNLPQTFVKLALLDKQEVVEKHRTTLSMRKTLDPLYQQLFTFQTPYTGKILQVSVWGDYGRIDRKAFMGICEVLLDDLNLKNIVFGWYKLYATACSTVHHSYHHRRRSSCSTPQAKIPMM